jgi:hypothetical protein
MDISNALSAASSGDALKQAVGLALLNKVQDAQAAQTATLLQDFAASQAPHPYLGKNLDIKL